jgi:hypothetical protein
MKGGGSLGPVEPRGAGTGGAASPGCPASGQAWGPFLLSVAGVFHRQRFTSAAAAAAAAGQDATTLFMDAELDFHDQLGGAGTGTGHCASTWFCSSRLKHLIVSGPQASTACSGKALPCCATLRSKKTSSRYPASPLAEPRYPLLSVFSLTALLGSSAAHPTAHLRRGQPPRPLQHADAGD